MLLNPVRICQFGNMFLAQNLRSFHSGRGCRVTARPTCPLPRSSDGTRQVSSRSYHGTVLNTVFQTAPIPHLPLTPLPHPCYRLMFALPYAARLVGGKPNLSLRRPFMPAIKFRGVDFIQYDSLLTDEERLVRDSTRQFIEDNLIPIIEECNRAGRFPRELVKPMADMGFFGASLKGYGCAGMGNVEYGLMTQELERGDSGVRSFVSVQSGLCMYPIYEFGSE